MTSRAEDGRACRKGEVAEGAVPGATDFMASRQIGLERLKLELAYAEHAGQVYWSRFNIFAVMSAAMLVAWAKDDAPVDRMVVCFGGAVVAFAWAAINARASLYFRRLMRCVKASAEEVGMESFARGLDRSEIPTLAPALWPLSTLVRALGSLPMIWVSVAVSATFFVTWLALCVYGACI